MRILVYTLLVALVILLICVYVQTCSGQEEPDWDRLIPAIISVESSGNPNAVSNKGAIGLMGITPIVLREFNQNYHQLGDNWLVNKYNVQGDFPVLIPQLFDYRLNQFIGEWYLHRLKDHYLKENYTIERLLAAWNIGPARLKELNYKWLPDRETGRFVKKVMNIYKN